MRHLRPNHVAGRSRRSALICAGITALFSFAMPPTTACAVPSDMNCDGAVNVADIPLFVDALLATGTFGGCDITRADMNADGLMNGRDVQPFVSVLLAPLCGIPLVFCNGVCVDLNYDNGNCGACGVTCSSMETCVGGHCELSQPCPDCP